MISTFRFCTVKVACSSPMSSMVREARMLQKMIKKSLTPKKRQVPKNSILNKGFFSPTYDNEITSHRMTALNKIYMERIIEMLQNGKYGQKLTDLEVEVTKVKLSKGYNFLHIYVMSKNIHTPNKILNETLSGALAELQAKVGEFSFFEKVPYLKFVRDKALENAIQVEKIFEIMDFGKDFQPNYEKKVITQDSSVREDHLPEMRQNVFGVDVSKIKGKIAADIFRYKAINIETSGSDLYPEFNYSQKLMNFNKKEFIKFFKSKRIAELKRRKIEKREMDALNDDFEYVPHNIYEDESDFEDAANENEDYDVGENEDDEI